MSIHECQEKHNQLLSHVVTIDNRNTEAHRNGLHKKPGEPLWATNTISSFHAPQLLVYQQAHRAPHNTEHFCNVPSRTFHQLSLVLLRFSSNVGIAFGSLGW